MTEPTDNQPENIEENAPADTSPEGEAPLDADPEGEETQDDTPINADDVDIETRGVKKPDDTEPVGDDIDPDDERAVGKIVQKQLEPVTSALKAQRDQLDVESFVNSNPEFSKYKSVILKHASHPAYSKVPISKIASMVASEDLQKMGAKKEREAQKQVDSTKNPGSTVRKSEGGVDWETASTEEFQAERARVLSRRS